MPQCGLRARRALCLLAFAALAASATLQSAAAQEPTAVVFVRAMRDTGPAALSFTHGVAIDSLGNVYVADTPHHRIVKFDPDGVFVRAFGTEGSGPGNLYYPVGVAVSALPGGGTGIYVLDNGNHRVAVFTTGGSFVRQFGSEGSGNGQLLNPAGIATVPGVPAAGVFVADTRNHRVVRFSLTGTPLQTFTCGGCPDGDLLYPPGIAVRKLQNGSWQIYVVDSYRHQVHVLSANGHYMRSFGEEGSGDGGLGLADDVAVDEDGTAYVVDPGFGNERVTAFSPSGAFRLSFDSTGAIRFVQPHGIAVDEQGNIYVADTANSNVYKFALRPPRIIGNVLQDSAFWVDNRAAKFGVRYNGVERTCNISGTAQLTAPTPGGNRVFTLSGRRPGVGASAQPISMRMTAQQANWLDQAQPGRTTVLLSLSGFCEGALRLTAEYRFNV